MISARFCVIFNIENVCVGADLSFISKPKDRDVALF